MEGLIAHCGADYLGRQELLTLPVPESMATHKVVSHADIVAGLIESLHYRHLHVVRDQYALTTDGMRMFGFLEINDGTSDVGVAIGVRNSHDKTFSLGLTVGYRVFVCDNLAFHGDFTPVTRKHTKHFDPVEVIDVAVGKMQRHFEPMKREIDVWQHHSLADHVAKSVIFDAFIADGVDAPKHIAREVARYYFEPDHPEFEARNLWTLSNGFTSAFKALEPVPQMKAIASLGPFLALYK
jgi:hypothetical protein